MKTLLATICLVVMLLPAAPATADEIGWSGHWLDRIVEDVIAIFDAVGGALVPTGEPTARSSAQDDDPDRPKVPLNGEPDPSGEGTTILN